MCSEWSVCEVWRKISQHAWWQKIAAVVVVVVVIVVFVVVVVVVVFRHDDGGDDDDDGDAPATTKTGRFSSSQMELETFRKSASLIVLNQCLTSLNGLKIVALKDENPCTLHVSPTVSI